MWVSVRKTYLVFMENDDWRHSPKVDVPKLHAMILDVRIESTVTTILQHTLTRFFACM